MHRTEQSVPITPSPSSTPARIRSQLFVLLGLLLLASILRLLFINSDSLFYDEAWHMELSTGRGSMHLRQPVNELIAAAPNCLTLRGAPPWYAIWNHMDWVIHPPLYHTLLRFWRDAFGEGGVTARVFSVVWSVLAIALFYDVVRRLHGVAPALWAAALMTLSATQIAIAQEARGYTLLVALGVAALWFTVRIARDGATIGRCAGLGLAALAMMLTHYFAAGVCAGLALFALVALRGRTRIAMLAALLAAAAVFAITWGPTLRAQVAYVESSADVFLKDPPDQSAAANTLGRLAVLPARLVFVPSDRAYPAWMLVWVAVLPLTRRRQNQHRKALLLWMCWLLGGVALVAALDVARSTHHLWFIRYTVAASPAVCALLAAGPAYLAGWRRHVLPACACVVAAATLRGGYLRDNPDLRAPAAYLAQKLSRDPTTPLLIASPDPLGRDGQTFYLGMCLYADIFPRPMAILTHPANESLLQDLGRGRFAVLAAPYVDMPADHLVPGCTTLNSRQFQMGWTCYEIRLPDGTR